MRLKTIIAVTLGLLTLVILVDSASGATELPVGGGWHAFDWVGGDGTIVEQGPFTFTTDGATFVTVTDAFCWGDRFTLSDTSRMLGSTSAVDVGPCPGSFELCDSE